MKLHWPDRIWERGDRGWLSREPNPKELAERQYVEDYWRAHGKPPKRRQPEQAPTGSAEPDGQEHTVFRLHQ